ncbi:TPA: hypothetical protein ACMDQE_002462 [Vibrio cholerae]|uniref:hypothetical protein n=2 Tax=Vibrio cholerae TaxID=666 RepID=UPI003ACB1B45
MNYFKLLVFFLSLFPLVNSILFLLKGKINTAVAFYPIFFLLYPIHLAFDIFFGVPDYPKKFYNFSVAIENESVVIIYLVYIFLIILLIWFLQHGSKTKVSDFFSNNRKINSNVKRIFILALSLFSFYFLVSPNPEDYLYYGKIRNVVDELSSFDPIYLSYGRVSFYSMISAFFILIARVLLGKECSWEMRAWLLFLLLVNIYVNNKRLIMAFLPLFYLVEFLIVGGKNGSIKKVIFSLICFAVTYYLYAIYIKIDSSTIDDELIYFYLRHELGRDDVIMFVINHKILLGRDIMDYSGQSFVSSLMNYVPRFLYEDKPYPYGQYLTNSLIYGDIGPALIGWTVTTSILDEFLANFGVLGFVCGPIFIIGYCKYTDTINSPIYKLLFIFLMMLLFLVHTSLYAALVYICLLYFLKNSLMKFFTAIGCIKRT